jgi:hypothetical protein
VLAGKKRDDVVGKSRMGEEKEEVCKKDQQEYHEEGRTFGGRTDFTDEQQTNRQCP